MLTLILLQFFQVLKFTLVIGDCGFPGKPVDLNLSIEKQRYKEGEQIKVECSEGDKLLVFHRNGTVSYSQRIHGVYDNYDTFSIKCFNGSWIGGEPRCARNVTEDIDMKRISIYDDSKQQNIIDLHIDQTSKPQVLKSEILERVKMATLCRSCHDDLAQTCMTSTSKHNQKWIFWFQKDQIIPLIVLTIRYDPKLDIDQIVVKIKKEHETEVRTCKIFNVKRENEMRPRFIDFINKFGANLTYSPNSYSDDYPMIELTFICPVKKDILQEEKDEVSRKVRSSANYMEVYFRSQLAFDRPITLCSWEFMQFPEKCGKADIPINSRIVDPAEGFRVDYECALGYTLIENNNGHIRRSDSERLYKQYSRRCGVDGDWSDESPSCWPNVSCPLPHNIKYLTTSYKNQTYFNSTLMAIPSTVATFSCTPDYAKKGSWESVCGENGTWIGEPPFCSEQSANLSTQQIIIISLATLLIIGGLLVGVAFFIVTKKHKRRQQKYLQDVYYDDTKHEIDNHDTDYYESVNYEDINSSDLNERNKTASYLSLAGPESSLNAITSNYQNVTLNDNYEYLEMNATNEALAHSPNNVHEIKSN